MIALLAGPPFNKSLHEIGWFNRRQVETLFLRHRNKEGLLDLQAVSAERRALKAKDEQPEAPFAAHRHLRRMQGWPEYLIDKEIRAMRKEDH